jgi:hypothetical protein
VAGKLFAVTVSTAGEMVNEWVTEAALYVLLFVPCPWGADAVIVHVPAAVTVTLAVPMPAPTAHGPIAGAVKLTGSPELDVALTENPLPYCTFPTGAKVMVCDCRFEPWGRIEIVPDTGVAAL